MKFVGKKFCDKKIKMIHESVSFANRCSLPTTQPSLALHTVQIIPVRSDSTFESKKFKPDRAFVFVSVAVLLT